MKWLRYAGAIAILFFATLVMFSGLITILHGLLALKLVQMVSGLTVIIIGLWVGKTGLREFMQKSIIK
jgi:hypothetical protein